MPAVEESNGFTHPTDAIVYPNTVIGRQSVLEAFVILGVPPRGHNAGDLALVIGDQAHIRSHTVIYAGNVIGRRFETGHSVLVRESNQIGDDVSIGSHSVIEHHVRLADGVRIHSNAFIPEFSILETGAWVGPNVVLTNAVYPLSPGAKTDLAGPVLREGAKIGANATLLPGVVIGRDALVGAGAVVVSDVPDGKVVVGNPARVVHDIGDITAYRSGTK